MSNKITTLEDEIRIALSGWRLAVKQVISSAKLGVFGLAFVQQEVPEFNAAIEAFFKDGWIEIDDLCERLERGPMVSIFRRNTPHGTVILWLTDDDYAKHLPKPDALGLRGDLIGYEALGLLTVVRPKDAPATHSVYVEAAPERMSAKSLAERSERIASNLVRAGSNTVTVSLGNVVVDFKVENEPAAVVAEKIHKLMVDTLRAMGRQIT